MTEGSNGLLYVALVLSGVAAGFINSVAGGGSLLTLPILLLLGLPADVANGTNRVGVVLQSFVGVWAYRSQGKAVPHRAAAAIVVPIVLGSLVGAVVASKTPVHLLRPILLGTLMLMAIEMAVFPSSIGAPPGVEPRTLRQKPAAIPVLFLAGVYGGFVQAGVGFFLLFALGGLLAYDIHRANALKLTSTLVFGILSVIVFFTADQVRWLPGIVLGLGTMAGAAIGPRMATRIPERLLKIGIVVAVIVVSIAALLKEGTK